MNPVDKIILKVIQRKVSNWFALERSLTQIPGSIKANQESPEKAWPNPDKIPQGGEIPFSIKNFFLVGKHLKSSIHQGIKAIRSIEQNPPSPKTSISKKDLETFITQAKSQGIEVIGYTKLPQKLIFQERAVLYDSVIILIKEMDKEKICKAPSITTFKMVMGTYNSLSKTVNYLTDLLRTAGYGAQGGYPLGGLTLFPPLAAKAGLGWNGRHGLLITPQYGPRQRIAAIYTSIDNLPYAGENQHSWIENFCKSCGRCIRTCPAGAIRESPINHQSGRKTHISRKECLPYFVHNQGCSICIKECTFTKRSYEDIYRAHRNMQHKST